MIDKYHTKVLMRICKNTKDNKEVTIGTFLNKYKYKHDALYVLLKNSYIQFGGNFNGEGKPTEATTLLVEPEGHAFLEEKSSKNLRFWIPLSISYLLSFSAIIISIIALLK